MKTLSTSGIKSQKMESLKMQPRRFSKLVSGDSDTDYKEEMEPIAAIPAQLADNFHNFNDIHGFC